MKRIKANLKGSVLITVVCITTVCMILVATALKLATYTHTESTKNVSKTQAQVMSEKYLQYFLSSEIFRVQDPKTKQIVISYDALNDLAAATSQESPNIVDISLLDQSKLSNLQSDELGGTCKIYIYKNGEGIYVESVATYGGESMSSKAYFNGKQNKPYASNNTIETTGGYTPTESSYLNGDTLIEANNELADDGSVSKYYYTAMHNNKGGLTYNGNHMTTANYVLGNSPDGNDTEITFSDSVQQKVQTKAIAPTITAYGNIVADFVNVKTSVGKIDYNGLRVGQTGKKRNDDTVTVAYGDDGLSNKDGYINCFGAFIQPGHGGCTLGTSGKDIDLYCSVCVLGNGGSATLANSSAAVLSAVKSVVSDGYYSNGKQFSIGWQTNNKYDQYGNLYVYKGKSEMQSGDLFVNMNGANINGDLYVEGDIYVIGGQLKVSGNIYLSPTSKIRGKDGTVRDASNYIDTKALESASGIECGNKVKALKKTADVNSRNYQPAMTYSPGLFEYKKNDNSTVSLPDTYLDATPNDMYYDNNADAKYIRTKYKNALETPLKNNAVYSDDTSTKYNGSPDNKTVQIDRSCVITPAEMTNNQFKLEVLLHGKNYTGTPGVLGDAGSKDIVVALPVNGSSLNMAMQLRVKEATGEGEIEGYVYIMFYDPSVYDPTKPSGDSSHAALSDYVSVMPNKAQTDVNWQKKSFYGRAAEHNTSAIVPIGDQNNKYVSIADKDFIAFSTLVSNAPRNITARTSRIMMLLADGMTLGYWNQNDCCIQCLVYGPKASFDRNYRCGNSDTNLFYGQAKVSKYILNGDYSKLTTENIAPASGSILEYITAKQKQDGTLKFHYYFRGE